MKHTISILVENEFGALARIAGLFSGRGYNIESLTVAPTLDPAISRMTINTIGDDRTIEQIIKQLNRLISVVKVKDVTAEDPITKNLALIKVNLNRRNRDKLKSIIADFDAMITISDDTCSVIQAVADDGGIIRLTEALKPYGVMEFVSTGSVAIQKGKRVIRA
ncbi:MAG: acetolactate synthase small subunit [Deltaproteobacteria bacterium]|nr:acetolactate synthase small subunit [Deltaproteobacteria bacterium]